MAKLGVFDSGMGGYDIVRHIHEVYPGQDIVFLADQKNIPYGNKSREQLQAIFEDVASFFRKEGIKDVLIACNTMSSLNFVCEDLHLIPIIQMTADQVEEDEVLVLATPFTIGTHAYQKALGENRIVHEVALDLLSLLIENRVEDNLMQLYLKSELEEFANSGLPAILGCTHYPLVADRIQSIVGGKIYDSRKPVIALDIYSESVGEVRIVTNGETSALEKKIQDIFGDEVRAEAWQ